MRKSRPRRPSVLPEKIKKTALRAFLRLTGFLLAAAALPQAAAPSDAWDAAQATGELRWGADASGGAPYIFPDPKDPSRLVGFEVDIMDALAGELNLKPRLVQAPWDELVPALLRGNFDVAFNGLEITPARLEVIDFTAPYYIFSEQITTRRGDGRFQSLDDLEGHRAGTLSASLAQTLMEEHGGITVLGYPSPVESYKDLEIGRIDAVLLDVPIAAFYAGPNPKLQNSNSRVGEGVYAGGVRKDSPALKERLNSGLARLWQSGEMERIYKKWDIWTESQQKLKKAAQGRPPPTSASLSVWRYLPVLLRGAAVTAQISVLSMALAVCLGFVVCLGKLYGSGPLRFLSGSYIELMRGTPLLIQLYLLYYGLPKLGIHLNAFVAAVLGIGMNYAAFEAEIYRAGLLSVPKGQMEAARSLGLTHGQSLRYILVPQAFRTILPPSTSDFIALFKDTSLVSIITVSELTRAYSHAATASFKFLELGVLTALLYFLMSYPLALWSRQLEEKRHAAFH